MDSAEIDLNNEKQFPYVDGLLFGFPCNDFSIVGQSKGLQGEFGPLYKHGITMLNRKAKPKWFIAENVSGLASSNEGKAFKQILGEQGTVVIFDTGLWHRAGTPSRKFSRWSIFALYGPWFMKPYYDFPNMFKKNCKLSKNLKKLLHFNSVPPKNELERTNTLQKI